MTTGEINVDHDFNKVSAKGELKRFTNCFLPAFLKGKIGGNANLF